MDIFISLSIIIVIATIISTIFFKLKQPTIIGYILTGIIIGSLIKSNGNVQETIEVFSQFGISLLLFIIGLGLNFKVLKEVGKISLITGIAQVIFTTLVGFFIVRALGYDVITSWYIAIAICFSSTIIIMKILSDKRATEKLYGKISIGFLLVQDIVAVLILMFISSLSSGNSSQATLATTLVFGLCLVFLVFITGYKILPRYLSFVAKSQELLFLFSIAWGFGVAALFYKTGFSIEIGALVAGVALASSEYTAEIGAKLKYLRNFFIILFFILLGSQMMIGQTSAIILPALILSAFILIGNPLIVIIIMTRLGYTKKNSFLAGLTVAQISEFSLILAMLGIKSGHISENVLSLLTLVGLITITGSTYLMLYSEKIYPYLKNTLSLFENKKLTKSIKGKKIHEILLFGCNRIGKDFIKTLQSLENDFQVIDFNPEVIKNLTDNNIDNQYGDASDEDFLETLHLAKSKMIISTMPDFETNLYLIEKVRQLNKKCVIIVISHSLEETLTLYEKGASCVITPHLISGKYASMLIEKHGLDINRFIREKERHIKDIHIHSKKINKILG